MNPLAAPPPNKSIKPEIWAFIGAAFGYLGLQLLSAAMGAGGNLYIWSFLDSIVFPTPFPPEYPTNRDVVRDGLQDLFEASVADLAKGSVENPGLWRSQVEKVLTGYLLAQATVAQGRPLLPTEIKELTPFINNQVQFLVSFYHYIAPTTTVAYIANRSKLYSGAGRGLWYQITEKTIYDEYVIDYISLDDNSTCTPCFEAQRDGPYLPGLGPFPGLVCFGRGRCRCRREARLAPDIWAELMRAVREPGQQKSITGR